MRQYETPEDAWRAPMAGEVTAAQSTDDAAAETGSVSWRIGGGTAVQTGFRSPDIGVPAMRA